MNVIGLVKKHPYISAGAVFAIGLILVLALSGGSARSDGGGTGVAVQPLPGANNGAYDASVALGTIQGQVAAYGIDAQKAVALDTNATDLAKTRAGIEMMNNANVLQATVQTHALDVSQNIVGLQTKRDVDVANVNANAAISINQSQVNGQLALNAQNVTVAQSAMNFEYQQNILQQASSERLNALAINTARAINDGNTASAERLGALTINTAGSVDLAGISSNERLGALASNTARAINQDNISGAYNIANLGAQVKLNELNYGYQMGLVNSASNERLGAEAIRQSSFGNLNINAAGVVTRVV